jgi:hypothetical protein
VLKYFILKTKFHGLKGFIQLLHPKIHFWFTAVPQKFRIINKGSTHIKNFMTTGLEELMGWGERGELGEGFIPAVHTEALCTHDVQTTTNTLRHLQSFPSRPFSS